jgi:hypothetical protein
VIDLQQITVQMVAAFIAAGLSKDKAITEGVEAAEQLWRKFKTEDEKHRKDVRRNNFDEFTPF